MSARHEIPLKGQYRTIEGRNVRVTFVQDGRSAFVADVAQPNVPLVDLLAVSNARLEPRLVEDLLHLGEQTLTIPRGKGGDLRVQLAEARLSALSPTSRSLGAGRWSDDTLPHLYDVFVSGWLREDEVLIATLPTVEAKEVQTSYGPDSEVNAFFLLTDRRAALVWVGDYGDALVRGLGTETLVVDPRLGRSTIVTCESETWHATAKLAGTYLTVAPFLAWRGPMRMLGAAREFALAGKAKEGAALVTRSADSGEPVAAIIRWAEAASDADAADDLPPRQALESLSAEEGKLVAEWMTDWPGVSRVTKEQLLSALRQAEQFHTSVPLHDGLYAQRDRGQGEHSPTALAHLEWIDHLIEAKLSEPASAAIDDLLAGLPDADAWDIMPQPQEPGPPEPTGEDETETSCDAETMRIALLERRVRLLTPLPLTATPDVDQPADDLTADDRPQSALALTAAMLELVHLEPLVETRIQTLRGVAPLELRLRAETALAAIAPDGLAPKTAATIAAPAAPTPLSQGSLDIVRHPLARDAKMVTKLQAMIAAADVPDERSLRDHCDELSIETDAAAAIADACLAFGMPALSGYVSRGGKTIGIRAYDSSPSFLLIGADHLDESATTHLDPTELRFAIGSEVAHLRFGHARVTSSELWRGAMAKGKATLDLVLGLAPMFKAYKWGGLLSTVTDRIEKANITKVFGSANRLLGAPADASESTSLAKGTEELITAHRVMQLTADRAGLLLAGDLKGALRALFRLYPAYQAEFSLVLRGGLERALARRDPEGNLLHPDLAVRVSALIAFYLSDDYRVLSDRLRPRPKALPPAVAT